MKNDKIPFDSDAYARAYPDVAKSGLASWDHYERYGRILGRNPTPDDNETGTWLQMGPAELDRAFSQGPLPVAKNLVHDDLVSIIMPSYNNAEWITRAIHSVLSQQSVRIELIVIDDGSTDGSVGIASRIAADRSNMKVISLLRNFGCYYARNIGVTAAQGAYVTILDSDDIMAPDRILRQLRALKAHPEKRACLACTRRWSRDMSEPMGDVHYAENTLLWKRSLLDEMGYYDTVRFGGDTEFRGRIQALFGKASVLHIPDEVYFLRTLDTSLTTAAGSLAYVTQNELLQPALSDDRKQYSDNLTAWLADQPKQPTDGTDRPRMEFPQMTRPFGLGSPAQNASPSLGQRRVGAMASFPQRRDSLKAAIAAILPQLDLLVLYLNDYDEVPDFARHSKIRAVCSRDAAGDLRDNGKFYDLPQDDCSYVFTLDDDLVYPPDYTARLIHQIELMGRSCVVGVHGVIFPDDDFTLLSQRTVFHFMHETPGRFVDLLGTGTTAWHSSILKPSLQEFKTAGICDLWFAALCAGRDIPFYSVPRPRRWINEFAEHEISLWREAADRPQGYFDIYESVVAPALNRGRVRRRVEAQLARNFSADVLAATQVDLWDVSPPPRRALPMQREIAHHTAPYESPRSTALQPHFNIVLTGHNARMLIDKTLRSAAEQHAGPFSYDVTIVDDGSTDGSFDKLAALSILPAARLLGVTEQTGAAYCRDLAIRVIRDSDTFVLPLTLGDVLIPDALTTLARRIIASPAHDMFTFGHDTTGPVSRVPVFRRQLYIQPDDTVGDALWPDLNDGSIDALTRFLLQRCAPDRIAALDVPVTKKTASRTSDPQPDVPDDTTTMILKTQARCDIIGMT